MDRRRFLLASLAGALAALPAAGAQQAGKVYRIGFLSGGSAAAQKLPMEQFRQGLRQLDYIEGQNIIIEHRWADGQLDRLPQLATDLVRIAPDLIVAVASQAAVAAHDATTSIPIVMVFVGDPIYLGLATSLGRPGKNLTGLTSFGPELAAKQLSLLTEVVPKVKRIAVLNNPGNPLTPRWQKEVDAAAQALGLQLRYLSITGADDVAPAFRDAIKSGAGAMLVASDAVVDLQAAQISALALSNRMPTMGAARLLMEAGGLMAYLIDGQAVFQRAATYVDKILKGASPGDLPIEEPTKFRLVINLKTAKALGLTIPRSLLLRADQVIE
jgi:putative tryptophan/tyrosine transport system substrate-binding protein